MTTNNTQGAWGRMMAKKELFATKVTIPHPSGIGKIKLTPSVGCPEMAIKDVIDTIATAGGATEITSTEILSDGREAKKSDKITTKNYNPRDMALAAADLCGMEGYTLPVPRSDAVPPARPETLSETVGRVANANGKAPVSGK